MDILNILFLDSFFEFVDPKKRIFVGYLFISLIIALAWLFFKKGLGLLQTLRKIFDTKVFFSKSAKSDYLLFFSNHIFMSLVSPFLITQLAIATFLFHFFHTIPWISLGYLNNTNVTLITIAFTSFHFILDDFTKYIVHRWMHKIPTLWALHKVHHSATYLTPITVFRTHPLEGIIFSLRGAFTQGISISSFIFFFGSNVDLVTVLGANIFIFFFNIAGSNLRHSHIGIQYWKWLEYIIISPAQHQLHHSVAIRHHDKNYGVALAIWDWVFGSLHHSVKYETLTIGIKKNQTDKTHSLIYLYLNPIKEIINIFNNNLSSMVKFIKQNSLTKRLHLSVKSLRNFSIGIQR